ncbi:MAG: ATP-binding cassette domain-containing protein [Propionibacteriaceae bacterium]|jgi:peptide/nickel transport system ATP-binding protein|nr:ATP-binding cassette domain-containing protein [Propionibacteriaceae bacterium]
MSVFVVEQVSRRFGRRSSRPVQALDRVDLAIEAGQRWGVVGESGSGKTTLLRLLAGLDRPSAGQIRFQDRPLDLADRSSLTRLRASVQLVFQDPQSSLDPRMRVGSIITEPLRSGPLRRSGQVPTDVKARLNEVLEAVGLPQAAARRYPHEFSGGQRQRIAIARALAPKPDILLADEPVSALDVSVRAQVLNLINDLVADMGLTLVMVSHDLTVVRHVCDHVAVLKAGRLVETGPVDQVYRRPASDYTAALLAAVPRLGDRWD